MLSLIPNDSARSTLNRAILSGDVNRGPCAVCDKTGEEFQQPIQGHHHDYTKPLDVTWLCCLHHNKVHRVLKKFGLSITDTPLAVKYCKRQRKNVNSPDKRTLADLIALYEPDSLNFARGNSRYFQEKFTIP